MKKISLLFMCIFFFTTNAFSLTIEELEKEIKSLPVERISIVTSKKKGAELEKLKSVQIFVLPEKDRWNQLLADFKKNGVDTLIIRVFHNKGDRYHCNLKSDISEGVYFKTRHLPLIEDILSDFVRLSKARGFKVFAWMTTRYASYGRTDLTRVRGYSFEKDCYFDTKGINLFDTKNQNFIKSVFRDLASYRIDGILLQDDLFLRHNEGFCEESDLEFQKIYGKKPLPQELYIRNGNQIRYTELFYRWRDFKSKKMSELISDLKNAIKEVNPDIKLAVNLTYESITNPKGALLWLSHNLEDLKDVADYFSIMAYHRQIMDELNLNIKDTREFLARMTERCHEIFKQEINRVIFKLQIKDWKTNEPINENELYYVTEDCYNMQDFSIAIVPYPPDIPERFVKKLFSHSR